MKPCKDCEAEGITTKRKTPHPGPRCATHHRIKHRSRRDGDWERRLMLNYGISAKEYWAIYEFQGGACYICQRAKGTGRKRLSVDHCHETGVVRGLLCSPCNRDVVGHLRDDPMAFLRGWHYLDKPPAVLLLGNRIVPDMRGAA